MENLCPTGKDVDPLLLSLFFFFESRLVSNFIFRGRVRLTSLDPVYEAGSGFIGGPFAVFD